MIGEVRYDWWIEVAISGASVRRKRKLVLAFAIAQAAESGSTAEAAATQGKFAAQTGGKIRRRGDLHSDGIISLSVHLLPLEIAQIESTARRSSNIMTTAPRKGILLLNSNKDSHNVICT